MHTRKGLFLLIGECFRDAAPLERRRDVGNCFKNQQESTQSHCALQQRLESLGWDIDIAINTYKSIYESDLRLWYKNIRFYHNVESDLGSLTNVVHTAIQNTFKVLNLDNYDFVFVCRLDLLLKPALIHMFDPNWTKLTFPNIMGIYSYHDKAQYDVFDVELPDISDVFCFIPRSYYKRSGKWTGLMTASSGLLHHFACVDLYKNGLTMDEIGFVTDRIYIANTLQQINPLYAINCRGQGPPAPFSIFGTHRYDAATVTVIPLSGEEIEAESALARDS
jgi:hypothetical protein